MGPDYVHFDDLAAFAPVEGVEGRPLFGDKGMINVIDIFCPVREDDRERWEGSDSASE